MNARKASTLSSDVSRRTRRPGFRRRVSISEFDPSMTKQSFLEECDINNVVKRYVQTGYLPEDGRQPQFLDCTTLPVDYQDAMNKVVAAQFAFEQLSSDVRAFFQNDPARFVEFASNPDNLQQMRDWKLAPPEAPKETTLSDVVEAVKASKVPDAKGVKEGTVSDVKA